MLEQFRTRLDQVIRASGGSRTSIAERCGIDRSSLTQLLSPTNRRLPRTETLVALANTLDVSVDWLLGLSNVDPIRAGVVNEEMSFASGTLADNDELLMKWLVDAIGYKIRYVPSTLPDLLKTQEVITYEVGRYVASRPEQKIETAAARLAWTRGPETDLEVCSSVESVITFAQGAGIWAGLAPEVRLQQLDHMARLLEELYPTLRWFLFDGLQRYASPVTIFGPQRAALYLGQMYLVLDSANHVRTLTRHFDDLIRGAVIQPHGAAEFVRNLRPEVRRA